MASRPCHPRCAPGVIDSGVGLVGSEGGKGGMSPLSPLSFLDARLLQRIMHLLPTATLTMNTLTMTILTMTPAATGPSSTYCDYTYYDACCDGFFIASTIPLSSPSSHLARSHEVAHLLRRIILVKRASAHFLPAHVHAFLAYSRPCACAWASTCACACSLLAHLLVRTFARTARSGRPWSASLWPAS